MARYDLKLVPDTRPNADGFWITADIPEGFDPFKLVPLPEHHVVQVSRSDDPRQGGPMHLMGQPLDPAPYQFNSSWIET